MKFRPLIYSALAGAVALTMMTGCSRPSDGQAEEPVQGEGQTGEGSSDDPIRLGVPGTYSGPSASAGNGILEGLEIKVAEINDSGGLLDGRTVELITRDHGTDPDTAIDNMRELIEKQDIAALIGESTTGPLLATAPIANEAGVPFVVAGGTGTKATQQPDPNYIFRVSLVDDRQTAYVAEQALDRSDKIALMTDTSGLGQGGREDLLSALTERDVDPVADETFNVGDTDMTSQLSRVQEAGAEVIIFWGVGPEAAQIRRGMDSLGMDQQMLANWGLGMPNYPELAGDLANGTLVVETVSFYQTEDPQAQEALAAYEEKYGTDRLTFAQEFANAYDAMGLLADAIEKAGSTDHDAIREGLLDAQFDGLIKNYDRPWTDDDHEAIEADDFMMTEVQDGNLVPVS